MRLYMRVVFVIYRLFLDWQFWVVAVFLLSLYTLVSRITALDKKPAAVYVRLPASQPQAKPAAKAESGKAVAENKGKAGKETEEDENESSGKKGN